MACLFIKGSASCLSRIDDVPHPVADLDLEPKGGGIFFFTQNKRGAGPPSPFPRSATDILKIVNTR